MLTFAVVNKTSIILNENTFSKNIQSIRISEKNYYYVNMKRVSSGLFNEYVMIAIPHEDEIFNTSRRQKSSSE